MKPPIYFTTEPRSCTCGSKSRIHRDARCAARCDACCTVDGGTVQYAGRTERVLVNVRCMLVHDHHGDHRTIDEEIGVRRWPRG